MVGIPGLLERAREWAEGRESEKEGRLLVRVNPVDHPSRYGQMFVAMGYLTIRQRQGEKG